MKKQVRAVTEGAMMLAMVGLFLYINRLSGHAFDGILSFVMPLPAIFYIAKYGFKQGLILAASMFLLGLIIADLISLFYVITAIVVGLVYGYGIYKDKDNGWLLLWTTALTAISFFIEMVLLANFFGYNYTNEVSILIETLQGMGMQNLPANMDTLILSIYPLAMLMTAFVQALVTHILAVILLKRLQIKTRSIKPLSQIYLPKKVAILFALGLFANFGVRMTNDETIQIILTNIGVFSMVIFCIDAYVFMLIVAKITKRSYLGILSVLLFLFIPYVGVAIGMFDSFTDLRKRVLYTYAQPTE